MEWIKCSDRLPFELSDDGYRDVECLVTDGSYVSLCYFQAGWSPKPWRQWSEYGGIDNKKITHWMLKPEAPKK